MAWTRLLVRGALAVLTAMSITHGWAEPGVTETSILIGQSADTSKISATVTAEYVKGIAACFAAVNNRGGIFGRKLKLITLDDGFVPERTVANTMQLIQKELVFALIGYRGTENVRAVLPMLADEKVPLIGNTSGVKALRDPVQRYLFHTRASTADEVDLVVGSWAQRGMNRIAVVYQNDGFGKEGLAAAEESLRKRNLKPVGTAPIERNSTDVTAAVATVANNDPQALLLVGQAKAAAVFIRELKKKSMNPTIGVLSIAGGLFAELGPEAFGVLVSQVVPNPWGHTGSLVKAYRESMIASGSTEFSFTSLEGYIAARVLVEGLRRAGKVLTRDRLVSVLESMRAEDLGGVTIRYSPTDHGGSRFADITMIRKDGTFVH